MSDVDSIVNDLYSKSDIDHSIDAIKEEQKNSAVFLSSDKEPEQHAKVLSLAESLGVKSDFVEKNYADLMKRRNQEDLNNKLDQISKDSPQTANFLFDPDNLAISKDDLDNLTKIEKAQSDFGFASQAYSSLGAGISKMLESVAQVPAGMYSLGALPQNLIAHYIPESGLSEVKPPEWLSKNPVANYYGENAKSFSYFAPQASKSVVQQVQQGHLVDAGETLALQVIQNLPQQVALAMAAVSGAGTAGLVGMGATSGSSKLQENLDAGYSPTQSTLSAMTTGTFEAAFESLGTVGLLKSWEHALEKELGKNLLTAQKKEIYKAYGKTLAHTMLGEGTEEAATEIANQFSDYMIGVNPDFSFSNAIMKAGDAFVVGAGAGGLSTGTIGAVNAHMSYRAKIQQAKVQQKLAQSLSDSAKNSTLLERSPEKFKQYMSEQVAGTDAEDMTIKLDAFNALFQSKGDGPIKAAQDLGIGKEYDEATKTGSDITLKTADALTKMGKSGLFQELSQHIKFGSNESTVSEMIQQQAELKETLSQLDNEAKEKKIPDFENQVTQIKQELSRQLVEAGTPKREAEQYATLAAARYKTIAIEAKMQPSEVFSDKRFGIGVTNEGIRVGGEVFYQPSDSRLNHRINVLDISTSKDPNVLNYQNFANIYKTPARDVYSNKLREINGSSFANQIIGSNKPLTVQINKLSKEIKTKNGLKYENIGPQHLAAVEYLPELLNSAEPMSRSRAKPNELNLYNTFTFNGSNYLAKFQVDLNGKKITDMRVRPIGPTPENVSTPEGSNPSDITKPLPESTRTSISVSDLYNLVKSTRENIDPLFQSATNELGFYSKLIQTIEDKMSNSQDVKSLNAMLKDIKPEERKWMGLDAFLEGKEKVSKAELLDFLRGNMLQVKEVSKGAPISKAEALEAAKSGQNVWALEMQSGDPLTPERIEADIDEAQFILGGQGTKFENYKNSGGENYREVLFTLPEKEDNAPRFGAWLRQKGYDESNKAAYLSEYQKEFPPVDSKPYKSSHWDEKNVLAHTRLQDFTDSEGKRVLMVEEIQSDWHQEGRKKGYKTAHIDNDVVDFLRNETEGLLDKLIDRYDLEGPDYRPQLQAIHNQQKNGVPDAPFKKTWHEFVFKRIARMAAEQGYDKIAWTTGEQQAERYDLSKSIENVEYIVNQQRLMAYDKSGTQVMNEVVPEENLSDYIGKEAAEKLVNQEPENGFKTLDNADLKIGGEGMKGFYDKILVDYAKKFGKKFGASVEETELNRPSIQEILRNRRYEGIKKVHALEVTPEMRESVMSEGLPLFQGEDVKQGAFDPDTMMIHLLQAKDRSTFIHEFGHAILFMHNNLSKMEGVNEQVKEDMNTILDYLGAESFDSLTTEQHEKWARTTEAYVMEGKAPTEKLRKVFHNFKVWFLQKYASLVIGSKDQTDHIKRSLDVDLTNEVREVLDRMFASEQEINKTRTLPMFNDPKAIGLSDSESLDYLNAAEWARIEAEDGLRAKLMKDIKQKHTAEYKAKYNELYDLE